VLEGVWVHGGQDTRRPTGRAGWKTRNPRGRLGVTVTGLRRSQHIRMTNAPYASIDKTKAKAEVCAHSPLWRG
jgi:hypothetical protein